MRNTYLCRLVGASVFYLIISTHGNAQPIIIKEASSVNVDGIISAGEWADADSIQIDISASAKVTILFKHDGTNFNFAFLNNLESSNIRFPEILLDVNNDKSASWMSDDWWFHVSATDCESNTAPNDYSNCLLVQPGWLGVNNFNSGPPLTDTVEIQIPFTKIDFLSQSTDTIGISFDVTNTFNAWNFWPSSGVNSSNPSTWGTAIVEFIASSTMEIQSTTVVLKISPNPVVDELALDLSDSGDRIQSISLTDLNGRVIYHSSPVGEPSFITIPVKDFARGVYILACTGFNSFVKKRIIKQ
ncbi:MAG: T9SS type A sorting domain-containing protein [Bacteroidetes bacterium]|nr:MAG: T9SS type A sorting domain-containing protein [Bacteroidota bacterium]